jgi:hypothetical protein
MGEGWFSKVGKWSETDQVDLRVKRLDEQRRTIEQHNHSIRRTEASIRANQRFTLLHTSMLRKLYTRRAAIASCKTLVKRALHMPFYHLPRVKSENTARPPYRPVPVTPPCVRLFQRAPSNLAFKSPYWRPLDPVSSFFPFFAFSPVVRLESIRQFYRSVAFLDASVTQGPGKRIKHRLFTSSPPSSVLEHVHALPSPTTATSRPSTHWTQLDAGLPS